MKVQKRNRIFNGHTKDGRVFRICTKYAAVEKGTVRIEAAMNFTAEQCDFLIAVYHKTMEYLDKNIKVQIGPFGTLIPYVESENIPTSGDNGFEKKYIKSVGIRLKPSYHMMAACDEMLENLESE